MEAGADFEYDIPPHMALISFPAEIVNFLESNLIPSVFTVIILTLCLRNHLIKRCSYKDAVFGLRPVNLK